MSPPGGICGGVCAQSRKVAVKPRQEETTNIEHPTSNIHFRATREPPAIGCWMLDVGCSMFSILRITNYVRFFPSAERLVYRSSADGGCHRAKCRRGFARPDPATAAPASGRPRAPHFPSGQPASLVASLPRLLLRRPPHRAAHWARESAP